MAHLLSMSGEWLENQDEVILFYPVRMTNHFGPIRLVSLSSITAYYYTQPWPTGGGLQ